MNKDGVSLAGKQLALSAAVVVEYLEQNGEFLGLGAVTVNGFSLRSPQRPMFVEIRNPNGVELVRYALKDCVQAKDETRLVFAMDQREGGLMEWMVHEIRPRYNTADWTDAGRAAADTKLELILRPVSRKIGERTYTGFSYQYKYESGSIPIYKILDRGTWEPGGKATGLEFWMRNCFVAPIVPIKSAEQFYSSEWYIPGCANPSAFQFLPLQTELQGFTFTAGKEGALVTWATKAAHVRSLFEKPRGRDVLVHWHEHCGDLGHEFATAPVEVLWSAGTRTQAEMANDYEAVRELVHETLHADAGLRRERVTTYGQIEEWGPADFERYRKLGLPKLLEAGVKTVYVANHFENNMNVWGVGNMCCNVDFKVAESVGEDKLQAFCRDAHAAGAKVEMWGNTALSCLTSIFRYRNGDADRIRFLAQGDTILDAIDGNTGFVRNASNAVEADHYTPVFMVLNLRDEKVRTYWRRRWKEAHDNVGLDGIFLDSSFNMSSDKFHYVQNTEADRMGGTADQVDLLGNFRPAQEPAQAIHSQYLAHLRLMAEMQEDGYVYCNEDLGVFGIHRHGPGVRARLDNLFFWTDCVANFDVKELEKAKADADAVFFRGLAYRMMWSLFWDIKRDALSFSYEGLRGDFDRPGQWHCELFRAYQEIEPWLHNRTILPGEKGVVYRADGREVLWAFEDLTYPLEGVTAVRDVLGGTKVEGPKLQAARHRIYLLEKSA